MDYGLVGDIVSVDTKVLEKTLEAGFVPIVSPLSADKDGTVLNVNADVVAARLARDLDAEKLIVVSSAPGILRNLSEKDSLVSYTDAKGLNELVASGAVKEGMLPKVAAIKDALYGGVARVHVISYKLAESLLLEIFTNEGSGTLVVLDMKDLLPQEKEDTDRLNVMPGSPTSHRADGVPMHEPLSAPCPTWRSTAPPFPCPLLVWVPSRI